MKSISPLQRLARANGIQISFIDAAGQERWASESVLKLMLDRLEVDREQGKVSAMDPVVVHWLESKKPLRLKVSQKPQAVGLQLEGSVKRIPLRDFKSRELKGGRFALELQAGNWPIGYHTLFVTSESEEHSCLLITAHQRLYGESTRQWGAFLPLYAAHSSNSWGAGNLTDWKEFARFIGSQGGKVVGTLPIMAAFLKHPTCEPSPYSPASRLFWNEFFIDVTAVPEYSSTAAVSRWVRSEKFKRQLQNFRSNDLIDYGEQWEMRRAVLALMSQKFFDQDSSRRSDFEKYVQERPEVKEYARFRATCDKTQTPWRSWEKRAENGRLRADDFDADTRDFYLYVQWLAQQQVDAALDSCREQGIKFYLDLPLGVNPDGFDAWRYRDFFARDVSTGAPPDPYFTKGQDWGFAPLHPQRTRELRYRYVIDYLRFQMRHTGLLRIDHVMGLHRLWWVPNGHPASEGAYISYPADELYAILSVESHLHKTTLIGENLGTVPPEVNKSMKRHNLGRMYVLQYEQPAQGPLREPDAQEVASINTHDMPMFAAHWKGLDILDRADLGLIPARDLPAQHKNRERLRKNLVAYLRQKGLLAARKPSSNDVLEALLKFLGQSAAETVLINVEDLWAEERSQNVPGTCAERFNWQRKAALSIEEMKEKEDVKSLLKHLCDCRFQD